MGHYLKFTVRATFPLGVALCYPPARGVASDYTRALWGALLIAFAQVALPAQLMQTHWFPYWPDGREGPEEDHFLWICHRAALADDSSNTKNGDSKATQG